MSNQPKTGDVSSESGKVSARNIITGIDIQGAADDEVLKSALEAMQYLQTGSVKGAKGVEAQEDIVTGFRYLNPEAPTRESFIAELKALREDLATLAAAPDAPAEVAAAVESLDETVIEAQKEKPLTKRIINRLRETAGAFFVPPNDPTTH